MASKPQFNQWVTWPYTLYALAQGTTFELDAAIKSMFDEAMGIDFAFLPNGSPVTLDEFLELVRNKYGSIDLPFEIFKAMDLGGGDQKKLSDGKLTISDFNGGCYLLTAHDLTIRITNADKVTKLAKEHAKTNPEFKSNMPLYFALNPKYETLFTGLSVYSYVTQTNMTTLILPIGSTDAQMIYIDALGHMTYDIQFDWKKGDNLKSFMDKLGKGLLVSKKVNEHGVTICKTLTPERIILGGSYMFGLDYDKINSAHGRIPYEDYDYINNVFKKVGLTTGGIIKQKLIMNSAHALCKLAGKLPAKSYVDTNKDLFLYNFESIVKSGDKGSDLCALLEAVSKSTEEINLGFPNIQLLGCPRTHPAGDISSEEIIAMIVLILSKLHTSFGSVDFK